MERINFIDKLKLIFLLGKWVEVHVEEGCNIKGVVVSVDFCGYVRLSSGGSTFYKNCKKI